MDYLAGSLELLGVWMIGNLQRKGFVVCLSCNAMWILVAMQSGVYGLIPVSIAMAFVNTRNYRRWAKQGVANG